LKNPNDEVETPLVCPMPVRISGGVGSHSSVNQSQFATTDAERYQILQQYRRIAIVGLSGNPHRPSHFVAVYMAQHGYEITPVNPKEKEILGRTCYPSLKDVPQPLEIVDIFRDPSAIPGIVEEAIACGAKVIWMQLGLIHEPAALRAREAGLKVVMDRCIKIEHARFRGGLNLLGLNGGLLSSRPRQP
jgi:predicted CoA-binding protein